MYIVNAVLRGFDNIDYLMLSLTIHAPGGKSTIDTKDWIGIASRIQVASLSSNMEVAH